jgi:hypothetical protein
MPMDSADWRRARKAGLIILGVFVAIFVFVSLPRRRGLSPQTQALVDACKTRYSQAHSHGDSILADAWIPRPEIQTRRQMLRCIDLALYR